MRWFRGDAGLEEKVAEAYELHLQRVWKQLPPTIRRIAGEPGHTLHDGRIRWLQVDLPGSRVLMHVVIDDEQEGQRVLRLKFFNAVIEPQHLLRLEYAVIALFVSPYGTTSTQIRYQEVDLDEAGRYVLRLSLWPFHEFAIHFGRVTLIETPSEQGEVRPGQFDLISEPASLI